MTDLLPGVPADMQVQAIRLIDLTARQAGLTLGEVRGRGRGTACAARTRQVAMAAVRQVTGMSYPALGRLFDRDPTTVIHGIRSVKANLELAGLVAEVVESLASWEPAVPEVPTRWLVVAVSVDMAPLTARTPHTTSTCTPP